MKKMYPLLLFVLGFSAFGQQKGISYQAVIINPNEIAAPGFNGTSIPLANKSICLSFQIVNSVNQVEYQESQSITTDVYGMVNMVIGAGTSGAGLVGNLDAVNWNQGNKKLVVGVNTDGVCSNYTEISNQILNYTPYSFYAQNADLKDGYVTTAKLADGAVTDAKVATGINPAKVGLGNVNNTSDVNKPVSTATQTALDLKETLINKSTDITTDANSTTKYPSVKSIKEYVDSHLSSSTIVDADATTKGKIQLTGDLGGTATSPTVPGLALKAPIASPTFTGTVTSPIYASTPQTLTAGATISWNPTNGLNASVILNQNSVLSFTTNPAAGSYGTIVITQDATGGRTITLPSTANKVLGSTSTTTIALSSAANAKDILNFYYDGTNCYWNIGQGYGTAAVVASSTANLASGVTGTLAVANGGTGSTTQNFVDLTTNQNIAGVKTFASNATFNSQTIGKGNAAGDSNLAVGAGAMFGASTGHRNTAIGNSAMQNYVGTSFDNNTSVGYNNLMALTTGPGNTSVGAESMMALTTGESNTSIGNQSLMNTRGSNNVGVGKKSGITNSTGNNNTLIGTETNVGSNNLTNATALGFEAVVTANNSIQLGNASVTNVKTNGTLTAGAVTYPNTDGTSGQVLSTNGSGVLTWATQSNSAASLSGILAIANGGTGATTATTALANLTGTQAANKVLAGPATNLLTLASYDGTSLTGWTATGGASIDAGTFKANGGNQSMFRDLGQNFKNKTVQFDVKITAGTTGFTVGAAADGSGGLGVTLRAGASNLNGLRSTTNWFYTNAGGDTFTFTAGTWYTIKIVTDNGAAAGTSWYINGVLAGNSGGYFIDNGTYFGIASDNATANFDNIIISGVSNATDATPTFRTLVAADIPILNQNTTGNAATATSATTATNVTGTVAIANGGTGATTKTSAFDALSPMTTAGDIIYGGVNGTGTRLPKGNDGEFLKLSSGLPVWGSPFAGMSSLDFSGTNNRLNVYGNSFEMFGTDSILLNPGTDGQVYIDTYSAGARVATRDYADTKAPINANLNDQTGTTYTLVASDNGKVITLNNAAAITLTVPTGLTTGFNCMIVQKGAGLVTISAAGGVTVTNRSGGTKTAGQNAMVTLISLSGTYFISGGDMQ